MSPDLEEFRNRILAHAKLAVNRAPKVESEASTNASLVQPFLTVLGYDVTNPDEVSPEHHADFSDKYQNKVDYAILNQGQPVIAIESKRVGAAMKDDRGQLRSYFNASPTVKLGILTDGLRYELYADSDKPNMMDEVAFLRVDLSEIAKSGSIDDLTLEGVSAVRSGLFNPEDVGAEAKRKLMFESIVQLIKAFKTSPPDDFIRFVLDRTEMGKKMGKLTQKVVDANRDIVQTAMEAFVAREALARLGFAPKDVVKAPPDYQEPPATGTAEQAISLETEGGSLPPSGGELAALEYSKNRLFYLVRDDILFGEVSKIAFRKYKKSLRVYYGGLNAGSLFDYRERKDGLPLLNFPALNVEDVPYAASPALDDLLLKSFTQRATEAGVVFGGQPVLRSIKGGHPDASAG
ncbi:type I restriction endonuclease [Acidisoma silvae]|uniref:Type I restriction enzyme HsdR N-terminal domain-containing protein n=1 Tax=Acidisoma silvae TaxID=2802396 RepID=A0A963YV04_9PROT|nr:type I restriction endonuclease [Acidisoma silvae]MCB8877612.1 type I restriction enzyme HsdR N-terminal domain-containing protein [Acidisoma silvae]